MSTTENTEHIEAGGNAGKTGSDTGASAKEKKPTPVKDRLLESPNEEKKETLRVLKNKQTAALCNVTKKRNLLSRLMTSDSNLHLVKSGLDEYNELFLEYQACYVKHWETITDETVQQHETQRYESKEISVVTFRNQVCDWIVRAEQRVQDTIGSSSGASNTSRSSTRSSTSSKVAKAKAKLAELMVEKAMLKQKQALHEQEQAFQLDLEIAKTKAREQALSACMSGVNIDTKSSIDVANETLDSDVEEIDIDSMHDVNVDRQVDTVDPGFMNVEKSVSVCLPSVTRTQAHLMSNQGVPENVTSVHHSTDFVDASVPQTNVVFSSRLKPSVTETYSRVGVSNIDSVSSIPVPESFPAAAATAANVQRVHLNPDAVDFRPNQQSVSSDQSIQQIMEMQRQQNEQVLSTHRQIASVMSLPLPEVPKFVGDVMEYHTFILAFDARVASRAVSDADRMYFLQQYLEGEARDLIAGCVLMEPSQGYAQARTLLQQQYGDPHRISMAYVDKVIGWPHIGFDDNLGLRKYSVFLIKCLNTMQSMSHMTVLNHSPNMQAVVCKLPAYLQNKWRDYVTKFRLEQHSAPAFCHLVRFIQTAAESANDPVFSKQALSKSEPTSKKAGNRKQKSSAFAVNVKSEVNTGSTDASVSTRRCFFCKGSHDLDDCQEFDKKSIQDKRNFLKEKRMCYGCFGYNHTSKGCLKKRTCKKCKKKHPTVLHIDGFQLSRDTDKSTDFRMATESGQRANAATSSCNVLSSNESSVILQSILPVRVSQEGSNVSVVTYAFYDQGSTGCFISEDLLDQVGATNTDTTLQLKTMHGNNFVRTKAVEGLKVADINNRNVISLPKTFSRSAIPVGNEQIPKPEILRRWSHLREIASDIPEFKPDLQVGLLIGSNCPKALEPLKVIPVSGDGPFAMLLRHGWTVNGPTCFNPDTESVTCHRVVTWNTEVATEAISPTRVLEMFDMDFEGCCVGKHPGEYGHSVEDRQFLKKAEADVHLVDGHYVLPFPFRDKDVVMPNNREQAVKRTLPRLEGSKMDQNMRWLKGPPFLLKPESEWPVQPAISKCGDEPTTEEISNFTVSCKDSTNAMGMLINRFSDWRKLRNAASVFLTLKSILLDKRLQRNGAQFAHNDYEPFNVCKIQDAEVSLIKYAQHCHFNHEIEVMNGMEHFPERGRVLKTPLLLKSSSLYRLDPFMDRGLLKVGGRLSRSQLPEETKHPILLPRRSHITDLIIRDTHQRLSHAGRNFVIAKLRERYWIPSINAAVRYHIHRCVPCRRFRRPCSVQKMADLPTDRLTAAPPFTWTGVDFFGPYLIKQARKEIKHYGVLFTCLASRCVHIETTTSLESDCFINTLRRFLCRRGPVRKIRCDNGTNFTGAERELRLEIQNLKQDHIKRRLLDQDIEWEFNPPYASHMGGIWERQIRSVRNVLASLLHDNVGRLDGESFRTLLCEVESIMNSRPLTPSSNNPDDLEALTPNHILTMKPAVLPPPGQFQREDIYLRKRWRKVQHLANLFWSRWKREYLLTLQQRTKWTKAQRNFQIGDIVLMKDDSTIRSYWPMGRIISTRPDSRGTVRSVTLKTAHSSELTRPIHKLVLLLPADEAND